MYAAIAEIVHRYDAPEALARELDALFAGHQVAGSSVSTMVGDYEPVDVGSTFIEEGDLAHPTPTAATGEAGRTIAGRYQDLGPIGMGGMGEVRRVRDVELNRTLAMKIVHVSLLQRPASLARFLEEAQATAQLQHPSIVPVHDIGALDDGRVWFTMKEVRGRTLGEVAAEVHAASDYRWNPGTQGWTFKRVLASFLAVCQAMAYAHERGVVHRDLKPDNVMVGRHGETYVLDWGLAKVVGRAERRVDELGDSEADLRHVLSGDATIVTDRSGSHHTRMGTVAGTPAFMAPEQARGEVHKIDARTDVYALGAMLYEILSGRLPYDGVSAMEVVEKVQAGPPMPVTADVAMALPEELVAACERAMARDAADRFGSAMALADEVEAWLDGARKREQALAITERALEGVEEAAKMLAHADVLQAQGDAALEGIETWRPEEDKASGWSMQDEAVAERRAAELKQLGVDQGLHGALRIAPDLAEAHVALAERYLARHARAEADRDADETARAETLVKFHAEALPDGHEDRLRWTAYLRGDGALTLVTDPPGAEVMLHRYEEHNRRLVEMPVRSLGKTPLRKVALPMGSYLATLRAPGRALVRYPLEVPRGGHWDGIAPGDSEPTPIWLPPEDYLGPDEVYVPAGWFRSGGDPEAVFGHPARRLWCGPLVMHRFPITNRQYLAFLDDLVAQGRADEALRHAPRQRPGVTGEMGALIYGFDGKRFSLVADADGDLWNPDWPVMQVDWYGASAYVQWLAEQTGRPWRLPAELEWEKAARGVDGRWYPWGDHLDASWCCITDSHRGRRLPAVVDSFPTDVSPFGLRGIGGNTYDWCADVFGADSVLGNRVGPPEVGSEEPAGALRAARGGAWDTSPRSARIARRYRGEPGHRDSFLGLRGLFRPDPRQG